MSDEPVEPKLRVANWPVCCLGESSRRCRGGAWQQNLSSDHRRASTNIQERCDERWIFMCSLRRGDFTATARMWLFSTIDLRVSSLGSCGHWLVHPCIASLSFRIQHLAPGQYSIVLGSHKTMWLRFVCSLVCYHSRRAHSTSSDRASLALPFSNKG